MAQSFAQIIVHVVFSTKQRKRLLSKTEIRSELEAYMVGLLQQRDCKPIIIKSTEDHVHLLFMLSENTAFSKTMAEIKAVSSKWIKSKGPEVEFFEWQNGYGAFSVVPPQFELDGPAVRLFLA
jgi:putative transposase